MANYRVRMPGTLTHFVSRNIVSVAITAFLVIASVNGAEAGRRQVLDTNLVDISCSGYAPNSVLQSVLVRGPLAACQTLIQNHGGVGVRALECKEKMGAPVDMRRGLIQTAGALAK
jgi:hypothetical protein